MPSFENLSHLWLGLPDHTIPLDRRNISIQHSTSHPTLCLSFSGEIISAIYVFQRAGLMHISKVKSILSLSVMSLLFGSTNSGTLTVFQPQAICQDKNISVTASMSPHCSVGTDWKATQIDSISVTMVVGCEVMNMKWCAVHRAEWWKLSQRDMGAG